ncbi:endonuclease domain-containing protein [Streptomyces sp. NPDC005302]|uniref:endonuclease domain-containing protein n=1 Tax=Streptomyces sp. NPDC005302 TaxID=3154675 RepID=UPI0033B9F967
MGELPRGIREWPCVQCWSELRWTTRGGNRRRICAECAPSERWRALVRRYGVDKAMHDAMYFDQDGACAVGPCTREARVVDHCHNTGRVRGLLCQGCNVAIGFVESEAWITAVGAYVEAA